MAQDLTVTGDLTGTADGSRTTGFYGGAAYAVRGAEMARVSGLPGAQPMVPVASFSALTTSGPAPLVVTFINLSTNSASYLWTCPGGAPSSTTETNPTITYAAPGAFDVTLRATGSSGGSDIITRSGYVSVAAGSAFAWQFVDGATISAGVSSSVTLALNVATGASCYASPDLLPGMSLSLASGTLSLVGDSTVPTVNGDSPGSLVDLVSGRDIVIEVMDSPIATIHNRTKGTTYGKNHNGTTWYACLDAASDGDLIEISPGAINATEADCNNYFSSLDNSGMVVTRQVTIREIPGRGRWRLFPAGASISASRSGITIFEPAAVGGRKTYSISGFDISDQWGTNRDSYGARVRSGSGTDWSVAHASVTFSNFKVGKTAGVTGSGFAGSAEVLVFEDGHVFDCGWSGFEHNFYVSSRLLTARGVRCVRSRGGLDGHLFKTRSANGTIEGCVFEGYGSADNTDIIQIANGGNWTITGCLLIQGSTPTSNNGIIVYENEQSGNQPWWFGVDGHSLLIRGNVFINRSPIQYGLYRCPFVAFRTAGDPQYVMPSSLTITDNNGAHIDWAASNWVQNASPSINWTTNNSSETYSADDAAFALEAIKGYTRAAGPIAATGGAISTRRFTWPHGHVARSDSSRGLG